MPLVLFIGGLACVIFGVLMLGGDERLMAWLLIVFGIVDIILSVVSAAKRDNGKDA